MNKEVCTALSLKRGSWKRYSMCKTDSNLEAYKKARNKLKQVTLNAKKGLERRVAEEVRTNPKSFWKFISKRTKRSHKIGRIRDENNLLTTSNEETADSFNKYFATVFVKEDAGFCIPSDSVIQGEHFSDLKFKEEKILKILEELKVDKAPGPDGLYPPVLFELRTQLAKPLKTIFERSFTGSTVPDDWKKAVVVPVFKKGKKDQAQNYRPVSLTCITCKVM